MAARPAQASGGEASGHGHGRLLPLAVGALGVVFGDIGTSPLYTLQMANPAGPDDVLGVLSLIFWGLTVVIAVKYLTFIMRADNRGEGGILALLALIPQRTRQLGWITLLVVAGAALLFGDGIITPAISVLSAIEGLRLAAPAAFSLGLIIAITVAILIGLFAIQRHGTGTVGKLFGPVMVIWFVVIGGLGLVQIVGNPSVLRGLSPSQGDPVGEGDRDRHADRPVARQSAGSSARASSRASSAPSRSPPAASSWAIVTQPSA